MTPEHRANVAKAVARGIGFDSCGIARAEAIGRADYLRTWLAAGQAGTMAYLHRHFEKRCDPRNLLEGARSLIVVAKLYNQSPPAPPDLSHDKSDKPRGRVAMYAWGDDYHRIIKRMLVEMAEALRTELDEPFECKTCVDTAPLLEREVASAAGIGWMGKNTMVLDRRLGSYFFLGELLITLELAPDGPVPDRCGTCTRCLDACPTDAFPAPYQMDASRCISYLTIERHEPIEEKIRPMIGHWVFGCDVCQQVCPYNRKAPVSDEPGFAARPEVPNPDLQTMLSWNESDYLTATAQSAMRRASLEMLKRNARIALENAGHSS